MATTATLSALDWLVRTYASTLLTSLERTTESSTVRGTVAIDTNTRMNTATTRLLALEAQCWADYVPAWDQHWAESGSYVFDRMLAERATLVSTIMADTDRNAQACLKAACRALEMAALRFRAAGRTLP